MSQIIPIYIPTYINNAEYAPARVLPRLLFYNGLLDCQTYWIESGSPDFGGVTYEQTKFPYFDNYNVVSGQFPTSDSLSLLFNNEGASYGQVPTENLYTTYWEKYIEFIYNPTTRILNCQAIIPLADYFKMELNDIVNFRGNYWHLRAINDYSLKDGTCNLQLVGPVITDVFDTIPTVPQSSSVSWSYTEDGQNGEFKIYDNGTTIATLTANGSGSSLIEPYNNITASLVPVSYPGNGVTMSINVNGATTLAVTGSTNTTISASFLVGDGQNYTITSSIIYNIPSTDSDAAKFIEATGISGSNSFAINELVINLKNYNLWNKIKAIYPLVGGTSSSTSYNLIDTGSYQVGWTGSVTYTANGVQGDGSTAVGNTTLSPNPVLTSTGSMHLSAYIRTSGSLGAVDLGSTSYPPFPNVFARDTLGTNGSGERFASFARYNVSDNVKIADSNKIGFYVGTNTSNVTTIYRNGTSLVSGSHSFLTDSLAVALLAERQELGAASAVFANYSDRAYGFFSIGAGLDATEVANLNTAVTTFVTTLGRNV
jgi:hypothetical protein